MRDRKKKRQIISLAVTTAMLMQLCAPAAAWAAVPVKKVKVITEFSELPEEVAHIQIPADAGEHLEEYLHFPETIEATVVEEYREAGSNQKVNPDRHEKTEDQENGADDSERKEDWTTATDSNAGAKDLEIATDSNIEIEDLEVATDSNAEEDEEPVENQFPQTATDSNAGEIFEDYEFDDEEILNDIPMLTDISVTWELDENREEENGSYYYFPVLPVEYVLAEGVELPKIEVSVDGGIALLALETYDIANGGISINSQTLGQYDGKTITGTSTTNVIVVDGVDATITISNLDIQIPLDKNDATASTWVPAIRLINEASLNLILAGKNTLKGGDMCAAIEVPEGCTLTISGDGSLKATGGEGAGIGASSRRNGSLGTIVIDGGDIEAYGGVMAAGIGGSAEGYTGTITINGGTVYAQGGRGSYYRDIQNVYG